MVIQAVFQMLKHGSNLPDTKKKIQKTNKENHIRRNSHPNLLKVLKHSLQFLLLNPTDTHCHCEVTQKAPGFPHFFSDLLLRKKVT